jgi:hypothetical protein
LTVTFSGLEEDIYTLKLFSGDGQFEDLLGYDLDGEAGAYPSGDGLEGGNFVVHFATDIGTIAFPTPLTPKLPSGSMIYDPSLTAVIGTAGDTDSFTINIDAGQTMTVLATASGGLRPTIQVTGPFCKRPRPRCPACTRSPSAAPPAPRAFPRCGSF